MYRTDRVLNVSDNDLQSRQKDILDYHRIRLPHPRPLSIEMLHSIGWTKPPREHVGCLSGSSQVWLAHRGRLALGLEALRFMGITLEDEPKANAFGNAFLYNLAGNAFDAGSFLAAFMCLAVVLGRCDTRARGGCSRSLDGDSAASAVGSHGEDVLSASVLDSWDEDASFNSPA